MGLLQRRWARRTTLKLRAELGGRCAYCGQRTTLQFDCKFPVGDYHHRMEWSWRVSFYREQQRNGNLQLLCERCNARKGNMSDREARRVLCR